MPFFTPSVWMWRQGLKGFCVQSLNWSLDFVWLIAMLTPALFPSAPALVPRSLGTFLSVSGKRIEICSPSFRRWEGKRRAKAQATLPICMGLQTKCFGEKGQSCQKLGSGPHGILALEYTVWPQYIISKHHTQKGKNNSTVPYSLILNRWKALSRVFI